MDVEKHRCVENELLYEIMCIEHVKSEDSKMMPHWHSVYELVYFTEGCGTHVLNDAVYEFSAGDVFLLSPKDSHEYFTDEGTSASAVRIKFSNAFYFYYLDPNCRFEEFPVVASLSEDDNKKAAFLSELLLAEAVSSDSTAKDELVLDVIEQFLILVSRNGRQLENEPKDDKLNAALAYIQNNFHNPIKISDIAKAVSYSPNYLSSQFSKKLGVSIHEYLQELRLYYARDLIRYSEYSISEICYNSGFKSMAYFSKAFKNKFSESPNSFRTAKNGM